MRILHGLALRRRFIRILQGRDLALKRAAARGCGCNEVLCGEGGPCARGCGAGYALAIFIPAALFCIFPITVLRWCLVGGATATSALFILANLRAPIFEHTGAKYDTPHPPPPPSGGAHARMVSRAHISLFVARSLQLHASRECGSTRSEMLRLLASPAAVYSLCFLRWRGPYLLCETGGGGVNEADSSHAPTLNPRTTSPSWDSWGLKS